MIFAGPVLLRLKLINICRGRLKHPNSQEDIKNATLALLQLHCNTCSASIAQQQLHWSPEFPITNQVITMNLKSYCHHPQIRYIGQPKLLTFQISQESWNPTICVCLLLVTEAELHNCVLYQRPCRTTHCFIVAQFYWGQCCAERLYMVQYQYKLGTGNKGRPRAIGLSSLYVKSVLKVRESFIQEI